MWMTNRAFVESTTSALLTVAPSAVQMAATSDSATSNADRPGGAANSTKVVADDGERFGTEPPCSQAAEAVAASYPGSMGLSVRQRTNDRTVDGYRTASEMGGDHPDALPSRTRLNRARNR
jgi:hypothetical protein